MSVISQNIADGEHSPSSPRKGWTPATRMDCKLAIYQPLPEDGVGDLKIWKFEDDGVVNIVIGKYNFIFFSLRSSVIFVANEYPKIHLAA